MVSIVVPYDKYHHMICLIDRGSSGAVDTLADLLHTNFNGNLSYGNNSSHNTSQGNNSNDQKYQTNSNSSYKPGCSVSNVDEILNQLDQSDDTVVEYCPQSTLTDMDIKNWRRYDGNEHDDDDYCAPGVVFLRMVQEAIDQNEATQCPDCGKKYASLEGLSAHKKGRKFKSKGVEKEVQPCRNTIAIWSVKRVLQVRLNDDNEVECLLQWNPTLVPLLSVSYPRQLIEETGCEELIQYYDQFAEDQRAIWIAESNKVTRGKSGNKTRTSSRISTFVPPEVDSDSDVDEEEEILANEPAKTYPTTIEDLIAHIEEQIKVLGLRDIGAKLQPY